MGSSPSVQRVRSGASRGRPSNTAQKTRPRYRNWGNNQWDSRSSVLLMKAVLVTSKILFSVKFQVNDKYFFFNRKIYESNWFNISNVHIINSQNNYHYLFKLKILKNNFIFLIFQEATFHSLQGLSLPVLMAAICLLLPNSDRCAVLRTTIFDRIPHSPVTVRLKIASSVA